MDTRDLLKIIACPKCRGDLELIGEDGFLCAHCGLVYPIRDEIPDLLIEDAIPTEEWQKADRDERTRRAKT